MAHKRSHKGNLIALAGHVENWILKLFQEKYPEAVPWAKKTNWKSPMARYVWAKGLIAMGWVNENDPRVKELFMPQMRGKRKKSNGKKKRR